MSKMNSVPGVNIQWPWSQKIVNAEKLIETRGYPLPEKYIGQDLALIETPGRLGKKNGILDAKIIGIIRFSKSFVYESKSSWLRDRDKHLVPPTDEIYGYQKGRVKYGWPVEFVRKLERPVAPPKPRGIVFANNCKLPLL